MKPGRVSGYPDTAPRLLKVEEVAQLMRETEQTIRSWANAGRFAGAVKPFRRWLIPERTVLKLIAAQGKAPPVQRKRDAASTTRSAPASTTNSQSGAPAS